jgi:hypothetical protein
METVVPVLPFFRCLVAHSRGALTQIDWPSPLGRLALRSRYGSRVAAQAAVIGVATATVTAASDTGMAAHAVHDQKTLPVVQPPSTIRVVPVQKLASSEARKRIALATSSGSPQRDSACRFLIRRANSGSSK